MNFMNISIWIKYLWVVWEKWKFLEHYSSSYSLQNIFVPQLFLNITFDLENSTVSQLPWVCLVSDSEIRAFKSERLQCLAGVAGKRLKAFMGRM